MPDMLDFGRDAQLWPNRAASRLIDVDGTRWHVQIDGQGPDLLLLHGTGASTHSWADLFKLLSLRYRVIAPDLPGQGFTRAAGPYQLSMRGMAEAIAKLLSALDVHPLAGVGHSAGAAILARMTLDGLLTPKALVSLNGALVPFGGPASRLFSPIAKLLAGNSLVPRLVAWRASDQTAVKRLLDSTGSNIPEESLRIYARLFQTPSHVSATLAMMAAWDLDSLYSQLAQLKVPLLLVVGDHDRTVPPDDANLIARLVASSRIVHMPGLGHLAHEESPSAVARTIIDFLSGEGL